VKGTEGLFHSAKRAEVAPVLVWTSGAEDVEVSRLVEVVLAPETASGMAALAVFAAGAAAAVEADAMVVEIS
jgi:hypothetical protein